jgi:hypothetical protein
MLLAMLGVLLIARSPGGHLVEVTAMDPEVAKALASTITSVPALLGALVGALTTYVVGHQLRAHNVVLDRQKARRERETSRILPFLEVVDQRIYHYSGVVGTLRAGDATKFREAFHLAISTEMYERSSIMVLARRGNALGLALRDYMDKERAAKNALGAIAHDFQLDAAKVEVTVNPALIDALEEAQHALTGSIVSLYDAIDDYLDGPALR